MLKYNFFYKTLCARLLSKTRAPILLNRFHHRVFASFVQSFISTSPPSTLAFFAASSSLFRIALRSFRSAFLRCFPVLAAPATRFFMSSCFALSPLRFLSARALALSRVLSVFFFLFCQPGATMFLRLRSFVRPFVWLSNSDDACNCTQKGALSQPPGAASDCRYVGWMVMIMLQKKAVAV